MWVTCVNEIQSLSFAHKLQILTLKQINVDEIKSI